MYVCMYVYINYKLRLIQVSFSFSFAVWKIGLLSKTLLYIWVTKQDLAAFQGCGVFIVDFVHTFSFSLQGHSLSVGWA